MIPASPRLKSALIFGSAVIHATVALAFFSQPEVMIEGGGQATVQARLGNSFEDLAIGKLQPEVTETTQVEPTETNPPPPPLETSQVNPERAQAVRPNTAAELETAAARPSNKAMVPRRSIPE